MENLEERKSILLEKLNSLKSVPEEKKSETEFLFKGSCGNLQLIETNIDPSVHGVSSGQFMERTSGHGCNEYLSVLVGIGLGCSHCEYGEVTDDKFLWLLEEGDKGVVYGKVSTFDQLTELANFALVL